MIVIDELDGPWIRLDIRSDSRKNVLQKTMSNAQKQKLKEERQLRLAKALRENLLKRKAQLRARFEQDMEKAENTLEDSKKIA